MIYNNAVKHTIAMDVQMPWAMSPVSLGLAVVNAWL